LGKVRDEIISNVNKALLTEVSPALNTLIASQKGESEIWDGLSLDWSIVSAPQLSQTLLQLGIKGLFFP